MITLISISNQPICKLPEGTPVHSELRLEVACRKVPLALGKSLIGQ